MINPLVSVVVATYNSGNTVVETLESIASQTYKNIQLIITDDGSTDNTKEVCKSWIEKNRGLFVEPCFITVELNTGICANLNRAQKYVKGEWNKIIAGDDVLLPTCIEDNLVFVLNNPQAKIVFSYPRVYLNEFKEVNVINRLSYPDDFFNQDASVQLKRMVQGNFLYAPTMFYHSEIANSIQFDERYYFEDWVFYINVLKKGYRLYLLEKETVCYRKSSASMQASPVGQIFNYKMQENIYRIKRDICFPYLPFRYRFRSIIKKELIEYYEKTGRNNVFYMNSYNRIMKIMRTLRLI